MALKKCKECGKEVSTKAKECPGCGAPIKQSSAGAIGCLTLFILFVIAMIISKQSGSEREKNWQSYNESSMAYYMMQDFVEKRLKSPSTAEYPSFSGRVKNLGNQEYQINSYVDAQNSFGATIRTRFSGRIKQIGHDRWKLLSLNILD